MSNTKRPVQREAEEQTPPQDPRNDRNQQPQACPPLLNDGPELVRDSHC